MILTELLVDELPVDVLLANLTEYVGEQQAYMLKEIVLFNNLEDHEIRNLIKEYIGE